MSSIVDCPACFSGNHEEHKGDWGIIPGVIGGTRCECKGDCAERAQRAYEKFVQQLPEPKLT